MTEKWDEAALYIAARWHRHVDLAPDYCDSCKALAAEIRAYGERQRADAEAKLKLLQDAVDADDCPPECEHGDAEREAGTCMMFASQMLLARAARVRELEEALLQLDSLVPRIFDGKREAETVVRVAYQPWFQGKDHYSMRIVLERSKALKRVRRVRARRRSARGGRG